MAIQTLSVLHEVRVLSSALGERLRSGAVLL